MHFMLLSFFFYCTLIIARHAAPLEGRQPPPQCWLPGAAQERASLLAPLFAAQPAAAALVPSAPCWLALLLAMAACSLPAGGGKAGQGRGTCTARLARREAEQSQQSANAAEGSFGCQITCGVKEEEAAWLHKPGKGGCRGRPEGARACPRLQAQAMA